MQPLIQLHNPITNNRLSIYDDGRIYGNKKGLLLGILNQESKNKIINLLMQDMYMFKNDPKCNLGYGPIIMYVRDDSRKHRNIRIVGWNKLWHLFNYIHNTESLQNISI